MAHRKLRNLFELYEIIRDDVIISYTGPFDKQVLAVLAKNIEDALGENNVASKKLLRIFIELAQNIGFYSAERKSYHDGKYVGEGILIMKNSDKYYTLATGNLITKPELKVFLEKSDRISKLDKEGLRELKRNQLLLPDSRYGGANIGLIQAALLSNYPLEVTSNSVDDHHSFLVIGVKIDK